jgi:multiple sugar transport system substrate-binding protein
MFSTKMFKLLMILTVLSMVLGACGGSGSTEQASVGNEAGSSSMVMTVWGSQLDPEVYQARLDLFNAANPEIPVELLYIPSDYSQKVQTMMAGGQSPCIIQVAEDVHGYSGKGQIISLNDYVSKAGIDLNKRYGTTGGLVAAYTWEDNLYAMPDRGGALILYYNKDMFDKAGIAYPTKDWTWTEFLDAAQKLTVRNGDVVDVYGFAAGDWWPWWMSFIYMNGGAVLDASNKPVVNSPEAVEAMKFYNDLVYEYKVSPSAEDYANMGQSSPDPLFAQGKVAMSMTGFWAVNGLSRVKGLNWDIAPLFGNKTNATVLFGSGLAVTKDCPTPDQAFKVIEFLTSVEGQMPIVEMKQDAPANFELLSSEAFINADWARGQKINTQALVDSAEIAFPLPLTPKWNEMLTIMGDNLSEFFLGITDAQTSMDVIQEQLEDLFSE